jgi:hypothetical protein
MIELQVAFDFRCRACGNNMGVTLKCAGPGLATGKNGLATVRVPCPTCQEVLTLLFHPDGALVEVKTEETTRMRVPEPSCN